MPDVQEFLEVCEHTLSSLSPFPHTQGLAVVLLNAAFIRQSAEVQRGKTKMEF